MIDIEAVYSARENIDKRIKKTPFLPSGYLSKLLGGKIILKCENKQKTGSFKIRGALNKISSLDKNTKGVITSSAGNHGQGVAMAANILKFPAQIVMPKTATEVKIDATKNYGAKVILEGEIYDEAFSHAMEISTKEGMVFVHAYEDDLVIAGQGTIGLEINERLPLKEIDCVLVPVGGGGLISGIASVVKHFNPSCKVIGVQTKMAPSMKQYFETKQMPNKKIKNSPLGDGVSVKVPSKFIYETYLKHLIDDMVEVDEKEISQAFVTLMQRLKIIAEPAGCLSLAAVLAKKVKLGKNNVLIVSGGNVDLSTVKLMIDLVH